MDTAMMLNAYWHSRLPETDRNNLIRNRHRCYYVASFDGGLYAVAIWTDPVARKIADGATLELRRFAIAPEAPKNTATRMLAWMVRDIRSRFPEIGRLISYQDAEAHKGTIYRAQGWRAASYSTVPSWNVATRFRRASQSTAPKVRWELAIRTAHGSISTSRSESAEPSNQAPETVTATKEGPENSGFVTPSKSENGSIAAPKGEE